MSPLTLRLAPLFLLTALVAACTDRPLLSASGDCSHVGVPFPQGGDAFLYEAEGRFNTPAKGNVVSYWGPVVPGMSTDTDLLPGSTVAVIMADAPSRRFDIRGDLADAWQVSWWATNGASKALPVLDEWVSKEDGHLVQVVGRMGPPVDGRFTHLVALDHEGQPNLLLSSPFWGRDLHPGDSFTFTGPGYLFMGVRVTASEFTATVEDLQRRDGVCVAVVLVDEQSVPADAPWPDASYRLEFRHGIALPASYRRDSGQETAMTLTDHRDGEGPALPAWRPTLTLAQPQYLAPTTEYLLAGAPPAWPTSMQQADEAVRGSLDGTSWFQANPDARIVAGTHSMGAPGSEIQDGWDLTYSNDRASLEADVESHEPLLPLEFPDRRIFLEPGPPVPFDVPATAVTWDFVRAAHRTYAGAEPDHVEFDFQHDSVRAGIHENTGIPYVQGSGLTHGAGLHILASRALVSTEISLAEELLGPPVPIPEGWRDRIDPHDPYD